MSTKTDAPPAARPAGVTHTISRAFLLDGQTEEKLEESDVFDRQRSKSVSTKTTAKFPQSPMAHCKAKIQETVVS